MKILIFNFTVNIVSVHEQGKVYIVAPRAVVWNRCVILKSMIEPGLVGWTVSSLPIEVSENVSFRYYKKFYYNFLSFRDSQLFGNKLQRLTFPDFQA